MIPKPPKVINIVSAVELNSKTFPEQKWIISKLFESGTINMISAAPNNYKSWLTLDISLALATGAPLFKFFEVNTKHHVWIINEEDTERAVRDRLEILNLGWSGLPISFSIQNQIKLDDETTSQIINIANQNGIDFIIFDSLRSIHDAEENNATEMQGVMDQLKKITNSGITVLFTHHNRKKGMFKSADGEDSRGSTAITAAVHSHLTCEPKKEGQETYLIIKQQKLKAGKKIPPFKLLIKLNDENGSFDYVSECEETNSHEKTVKKILKILNDESGMGVGLKSFVAAGLGSDRMIREVIKEMKSVKSIIEKTWKEVEKEELPTMSEGVAHNEKFYFLPISNEEA